MSRHALGLCRRCGHYGNELREEAERDQGEAKLKDKLQSTSSAELRHQPTRISPCLQQRLLISSRRAPSGGCCLRARRAGIGRIADDIERIEF